MAEIPAMPTTTMAVAASIRRLSDFLHASWVTAALALADALVAAIHSELMVELRWVSF